MKKIFILAILAIGILISGCEKCECDPDEYYIQYEVGITPPAYQADRDIAYTNENNETITYSTERGFSIIIGPVEKGYTASLSAATHSTINNSTLHANIQVSKNDGPFAEKASGENDTSEPLEIEYTIDF